MRHCPPSSQLGFAEANFNRDTPSSEIVSIALCTTPAYTIHNTATPVSQAPPAYSYHPQYRDASVFALQPFASPRSPSLPSLHPPPLPSTPSTPQQVTPNLDALVHDGIRLHRHYVHRFCTPSRTSLQSGRLPVHVNTGLGNPCSDNTGISQNMTGLAEHLKSAGYVTAMAGKWDAGMAVRKRRPQSYKASTAPVIGTLNHLPLSNTQAAGLYLCVVLTRIQPPCTTLYLLFSYPPRPRPTRPTDAATTPR